MAMSNATKEKGGLTDGKRMNHLVVIEEAGKDGQETDSAVPIKSPVPRRKMSPLLGNLRKSFNEFRPKVDVGASKSEGQNEGSKNDRKTQREQRNSKLSEAGGADIEGTREQDFSSEMSKVNLGSSLPDAGKKLSSFQASLNGVLDVSKTGNNVDKIELSLFYIVQHSKLQAVTLQRKSEEDWGITLGRGNRSDCSPSPSPRTSPRSQKRRSIQEKTAVDNNFNNYPDNRNMPSSSAKSDPNSGMKVKKNSDSAVIIALRQNLLEENKKRRLGRIKASTQGGSQPRHGVRIIGLTEGGVAERCGDLAVEDLIVEVRFIDIKQTLNQDIQRRNRMIKTL